MIFQNDTDFIDKVLESQNVIEECYEKYNDNEEEEEEETIDLDNKLEEIIKNIKKLKENGETKTLQVCMYVSYKQFKLNAKFTFRLCFFEMNYTLL